MSDELNKTDPAEKRLEYAIAARQLEIDLLWKRSLFFWGFIFVAFVALAACYGKHPFLAIAISCFGLVCSLSWTLLNRGSKYWYEAWEQKVQREEIAVIGKLFAEIERIKDNHWWVRARRYSVSKLLILLSDYVVILWAAILAYQIFFQIPWPVIISAWRPFAVLLFVLFTFVYIGFVIHFGRSSDTDS